MEFIRIGEFMQQLFDRESTAEQAGDATCQAYPRYSPKRNPACIFPLYPLFFLRT